MSGPIATIPLLALRAPLGGALTAAVVLVTSTLAAHPAPAAETVTIAIDNFAFSPADLRVAPGTTVIWANHDDAPHTVTSSDGAFKSYAIDSDETFSFTFEKAGSYQYFCALHPHMVGMVKVG
ncbi:MAG: cupredoxin domain-containing protein [Geminicoccaceae bacterium]